jgi:hypothetical protein
MLGHIEDKRRKLVLLEKSLLNALCAAFDPFEICARSCSRALVDIREGLLRAKPHYVKSRQVRSPVAMRRASSRVGGSGKPLQYGQTFSLTSTPRPSIKMRLGPCSMR